MYLHRYQIKTLQIMEKFPKSIIHGARRIGITTMLLHHTLRECDRYACSDVLFLTPTQIMAKNAHSAAHSIMFSNLHSNVSFFSREFRLSQGDQQLNKLRFTNGSTLEFTSTDYMQTIGVKPEAFVRNMVAFDNADCKGIGHLVTQFPTDNIALGHSGAASSDGELHELWVDSMKGKNDFLYYRLDWRACQYLVENEHSLIERLGHNTWRKDVECLLY